MLLGYLFKGTARDLEMRGVGCEAHLDRHAVLTSSAAALELVHPRLERGRRARELAQTASRARRL